MEKIIYDLIIIGGGPAGLSAAIYASRAMLDTLIIEKNKIGGQATSTSEIVNYPGISHTSGTEYAEKLYDQAINFGAQLVTDEIIDINLDGDIKTIKTNNGEYQAYSIIIATGAQARKIGFKGEAEFTGRGIAYCATCDGEFFKDMDIFVIGGGFAAAEEAIFLTRFGKSVTIIIREPDFTCAKMTAEQAKAHDKIKIVYNTEVQEVSGDGLLQKAVFINNETQETTTFEADPEDGSFGMFVFAGTKPSTELFKDKVELDSHGYIPVNPSMETNIPGVYAAGDLLPKELRQVVTAVADGAIAGTNAQKYVAELKRRLGLPEVSERKQAQLNKPKETKEQPASNTQTSSGWFPADMQEQLKGIFAKLTDKLTLVNFEQSSNPKAIELKQFLTEFVALSPNLSLENVDYDKETDLKKKYGITRTPSFALVKEDGSFTGIRFSGIPSGHELNSLVLAIYNTVGPTQDIADDLKERIKKLKPATLEIDVSLSCKLCPDVVAASQRIAAINSDIKAEMIDLALFEDLKKEKKIMSVPALIVDNDEIIFGSKTINEIVETLEK